LEVTKRPVYLQPLNGKAVMHEGRQKFINVLVGR